MGQRSKEIVELYSPEQFAVKVQSLYARVLAGREV
jgi:hypothetical protein